MNLPEEIKILKQTVRRFVERDVAAHQEVIESEERIPAELTAKAKELGFFGLTIPEEYGGSGIGPLGYVVFREELGRTNLGFGSIFLVNNGIGSKGILAEGTEEQKNKYLPPLARGEKIACFALTEPGAGSDAAAISTTADRDGDNYLLNGRKHFITNGPVADVITLIAVTDRKLGARGGITAFVVEKDTPGLLQGKPEKKMGWNGSPTGEILLEDCLVPAEAVLGKVGDGFSIVRKTLAFGRLGVAATALGAAQKLFELSCEYAKQRVQFGKPIANRQFVQGMIADMAIEIKAARFMVYDLADAMEKDGELDVDAAMAKLFASEVAGRVADRAVQIHGGMGYMREYVIERFYRDVRLLRIVEGTSEIQRIIIARKYLG